MRSLAPQLIIASLLLFSASCISATEHAELNAQAQPAAARKDTITQTPQAPQQAKPFIVHEWGTFTSVQTAKGETLARMYEEDEQLPAFVHRFNPQRSESDQITKGFSRVSGDTFRMLEPITQRLETPVLYFYGEPQAQVSVKVDFPQGVISEWYPNAHTYSPQDNSELQRFTQGSMTWQVSLIERAARTNPVEIDSIWLPSRKVKALTVSTSYKRATIVVEKEFAKSPNYPLDKLPREEEPFIFYRGVGNFELPIKVTQESGQALTIENQSDQDLSHVFIYKTDGQRGKLYPLGRLPKGKSASHGLTLAMPSPKESPNAAHIERSKDQLINALKEAGLFEPEARAMVNTWERSYFKTPGTRILYIVPRAWTDKLLPLSLEPKPDLLERVLIGRIESLPPGQQEQLNAQLKTHFEAKTQPAPHSLGPFLMPRLHALYKQTPEGKYKRWLGALLEHHHNTMTPFRKP